MATALDTNTSSVPLRASKFQLNNKKPQVAHGMSQLYTRDKFQPIYTKLESRNMENKNDPKENKCCMYCIKDTLKHQ